MEFIPAAAHQTRPRVLFVGRDPSSPQIAASLLRQAVGDRATVETASTHPVDVDGRSDEMLVAMGLDPADEQQLSNRALRTSDWVVALGTDLDVARASGVRYEEWDLEHVDLEARVQALGDRVTAVPTADPRVRLRERLSGLVKAIRRR